MGGGGGKGGGGGGKGGRGGGGGHLRNTFIFPLLLDILK